MSVKLFPYLLTRYASLPVKELENLSISDLNTYAEGWQALIHEKEKLKEALCLKLFELINNESDPIQRNYLLNLKRTIYNERGSVEKDLKKLTPALIPLFSSELICFREMMDRLNTFSGDWDKQYKKQLSKHRTLIQQLTKNELFRKGILLSSSVLYEQLDAFSQASPQAFKSRELRNEYSILRYLTRMVYKTSPFSTFTYIGLGVPSPDATTTTSACPSVKSRIRLNNKILNQLVSLMANHPKLSGVMYIKLNSSLSVDNEKLCFLMNYQNIEVFQKVPLNGITKLIYSLLEEQQAPITFDSLTAILRNDYIDSAEDEIKEYLLKLVNMGLLELDIACSGLDPDWDRNLIALLKAAGKNNSSIQLLIKLLEALQQSKYEYENASVLNRELILEKAMHALNDTLDMLHAEAGLQPLSPEEFKVLHDLNISKYQAGEGFEKLPYIPNRFSRSTIFYEDAYTEAIQPFPDVALHDLSQKMNRLCCALKSSDRMSEEREKMKQFFLSAFEPGSVVPLASFYQAYYKEKEKNTGKAVDETAINPPAGNRHLYQVLENKFKKEDRDLDHLNITYEDLYVEGQPVQESKTSRSVFVQFYKTLRNGRIEIDGVINNLLPGMGKISGRFLYLFDESIAQLQKEWNCSIADEAIQMELNDGSNFNANIHPSLLSNEIRMPGSNNMMSVEAQIPIKQISVVYHGSENRLQLINNTDEKEIVAYDLCLESFYNRSNLYKMLAHFNPVPYVSFHQLIQSANEFIRKDNYDKAIIINPRITFENNVVIRRKGWIIKAVSVPKQEADETDSTYTLRLFNWLKTEKLPYEVFVKLRASSSIDKESDTTRRDDYKPQYINFTQPLLVLLFKKLLQRSSDIIYFEEVLPAIKVPDDDNYHVNEHLVQWYTF